MNPRRMFVTLMMTLVLGCISYAQAAPPSTTQDSSQSTTTQTDTGKKAKKSRRSKSAENSSANSGSSSTTGSSSGSMSSPTTSAGSSSSTASADEKVWVNKDSKVYHVAGTRWYGKTKNGEYMTRSEAEREGYRPAKEHSKKQE